MRHIQNVMLSHYYKKKHIYFSLFQRLLWYLQPFLFNFIYWVISECTQKNGNLIPFPFQSSGYIFITFWYWVKYENYFLVCRLWQDFASLMPKDNIQSVKKVAEFGNIICIHWKLASAILKYSLNWSVFFFWHKTDKLMFNAK